MRSIPIHALSIFLAVAATSVQAVDVADIQFFGDTFIPQRALDRADIFQDVRDILARARHNLVNFEGAATAAFVPLERKRFLLKMPPAAVPTLKAAGIDAATLANNHAMDFGYPGLFDSLRALRATGIAAAGAGKNAAEARRPMLLTGGDRDLCILAFSRTLPESFWAGASRPGTAFADERTVTAATRQCAAGGAFTVVAFHWGSEMSRVPAPYQHDLAKATIAAGAGAVIGHHVHVLQPVEIIDGRPVFYSLGNFAFGSNPAGVEQEGMAVRVFLPKRPEDRPTFEIQALVVRNRAVHYRPRPLGPSESDPVRALLPAGPACQWRDAERFWTCRF